MALSAPIFDDDECHCDVKPKPDRRPPLRCVVKTGRCGMTQKEYACLLSIPSFRYRVRVQKRNIPNLDFTSLMWPISRATQNADCPIRCQDLFDLGERPKHFAREHKVKVRHAGQGPFPGGHWAHPGALLVPMKIRLTHLAVPRKNDTLGTKKHYGKLLGPKKKKLLDSYLDFYKKCIYFKEHKHKPLPPTPRSKADKHFRWPKKDAKAAGKKPSGSRIAELSKPRPIPKPKPVKRGPVGEPSAMDLERLATPRQRYLTKEPDPNKAFQVTPGALQYQMSDRVGELAQPRPDVSEPRTTEPFKVTPGAKTAQASARTKELATPVKREDPPNDDIREEPFVVIPRALTAHCSARTTELAEPRNPGGG